MKRIVVISLIFTLAFANVFAVGAAAQIPAQTPEQIPAQTSEQIPAQTSAQPTAHPPLNPSAKTPLQSSPAVLPTSGDVITHTVVPGDTMWKLAVAHEVGLSEIIASNPQIADPHWIYPGDVLAIPLGDKTVLSMEQEIVRLVNVERQKQGLSALKSNWQLARVARFKSQDMRDLGYFAHESPNYGSPFQMMKNFGISYRTAGENIAKGYTSAASVVEGWMNSPGHRANILNASFTEIGVGYVEDGRYYTQMFIG